MKFLVDHVTSVVSGGFSSLNQYPISGNYIVDVPWDDFYFDANPANLSNLLSQKLARFDIYAAIELNNPSPSSVYNEFESITPVVTTESSYYSVGVRKRTSIRPNGFIYLGGIPGYTFAAPPTSLYLSYSFYKFAQGVQNKDYGAYSLIVDTSVTPSDLSFSITNTASPPVNQISLLSGVTSYTGVFSGNFYVKITNNNPTDTFIMSDFYLYWI